jgi:two-component system LytT family sensor kinase
VTRHDDIISNRRELLERIALALLVANAIGLLSGMQNYLAQAVEGLPANYTRIILRSELVWNIYGILAPFVFLLCAWMRRTNLSRRQRMLVWIAAAITFGILDSSLYMPAVIAAGWVKPPVGVFPPPTVFDAIRSHALSNAVFDAVMFAGIALADYALVSIRAQREREARQTQLEGKLATAELQVLKMQLQPHFFFNTLHTISALMEQDIKAARTVLTHLGDLLRLSLDRMAAQEVPLSEELDFLKHYLDIQRTRFHDRLCVEIIVPDELLRARVPSLILQPLVENAIRHGIEPRPGPGRIEISARRTGDTLRIRVKDNGPGLGPAGTPVREGVGLLNTRMRLQQLYTDHQRLDLRNVETGGLEVVLEVPLRFDATHPDKS